MISSNSRKKPIDPIAEKDIEKADGDLKAVLISEYAKKGEKTCLAALDLFLDVYARTTGISGCTFLAYGGVYIAGGILPKVLWRTKELTKEGQKSPFVSRYLAMGPTAGCMAKMPLYLITAEVGIFGALYRGLEITKLLS